VWLFVGDAGQGLALSLLKVTVPVVAPKLFDPLNIWTV
jgi:hypothetical protein